MVSQRCSWVTVSASVVLLRDFCDIEESSVVRSFRVPLPGPTLLAARIEAAAITGELSLFVEGILSFVMDQYQ